MADSSVQNMGRCWRKAQRHRGNHSCFILCLGCSRCHHQASDNGVSGTAACHAVVVSSPQDALKQGAEKSLLACSCLRRHDCLSRRPDDCLGRNAGNSFPRQSPTNLHFGFISLLSGSPTRHRSIGFVRDSASRKKWDALRENCTGRLHSVQVSLQGATLALRHAAAVAGCEAYNIVAPDLPLVQ